MSTAKKIAAAGTILAGGALAAYGAYEMGPVLKDVFNQLANVENPDNQFFFKFLASFSGCALGTTASFQLGKKLETVPSKLLPDGFKYPAIMLGVAIGLTGGAFGGYSLMNSLLPSLETPKEKAAQISHLDTTNVNYVHNLTI